MPILALITEYQNAAEEQVVVLFQILAAEINFGYRFQTVQCLTFNGAQIQNLSHMATMVDGCPCALRPAMPCPDGISSVHTHIHTASLAACVGRAEACRSRACTWLQSNLSTIRGHKQGARRRWCRDRFMRFELEGGKSIILNRLAAQRGRFTHPGPARHHL